MQKVRLENSLAQFRDYWNPRIVGALNGQHVKLVKLLGEFDWHHHAGEDEMFLVLHGCFRLEYRDAAGTVQSLQVETGEFVIVPCGTEHRPCADNECHVLLFEPAGTLNTGNVRSDKTVDHPADLRLQ